MSQSVSRFASFLVRVRIELRKGGHEPCSFRNQQQIQCILELTLSGGDALHLKSQKRVSSHTLRQHCSENKIQTSIFHACGTLQIWYKIRGLKSKSGLLTTDLVGGGGETFFFI